MAIAKLAALAGPVDRIVLARAYGIMYWLPRAYQTLCERTEWLSDDEGHCLGIENFLKIARARAGMRGQDVILDSAASAALVRHTFGLVDEPDADEPLIDSPPAPAPSPSQAELDNVHLVVPASALPSGIEDMSLELLSPEDVEEIKGAISGVAWAQQEAQLAASLFEPLVVHVKAEVARESALMQDAQAAAMMSKGERKVTTYSIKLGKERLLLYAEQVKTAEKKVEQAKAAVAALVSRASPSRNVF
jgi:hypothetical protein